MGHLYQMYRQVHLALAGNKTPDECSPSGVNSPELRISPNRQTQSGADVFSPRF